MDFSTDPIKAVDTCNKIGDYMYAVSGDVLSYDARIFDMDSDERTSDLIGLLTKST